MNNKKLLITGGLGSIGSAHIRYIIINTNHDVTNLYKPTYPSNLESLVSNESSPRYSFEQVDICNAQEINSYLINTSQVL
jgi:dTDP-glucose 4,6-dehydratase